MTTHATIAVTGGSNNLLDNPAKIRNAIMQPKNSVGKKELSYLQENLNANQDKPNILVVEDDPISQKIMLLFLSRMAVNVQLASDGNMALGLLDQPFNLVITDMGLPGITGFELCRIIRQRAEKRHLPIIALTAFGEMVKEDCLTAGADVFMTKPVDFSLLIENIKQFLPHSVLENDYFNKLAKKT